MFLANQRIMFVEKIEYYLFIYSLIYLSVLSGENHINTRLAKACTAIDSLSIKWKSDRFDKKNAIFSKQLSILLYGCTTWTLTKCIKKKLDCNCARMLYGHPSRRPSKLDEQDMLDTAEERGWTHEQRSHMDPFTRIGKNRMTCQNLSITALCRYRW